MSDCKHDWRIQSVGENTETSGWIAKCILCPAVDSADMVNEQIDLLVAMNDSAYDMLDCYAEQITKLKAELAKCDARTCETCADNNRCHVQDELRDIRDNNDHASYDELCCSEWFVNRDVGRQSHD